jgi:tetratricopeptide (TPR) repeat protein
MIRSSLSIKATFNLATLFLGLLLGCQDSQQVAVTELRKELSQRRAAYSRSMELYEKAQKAIAKADTAQAREYLDQAIAEDDRNAYAWMAMGMLEYKEGNFYRAAHAFHRASRLEPSRYEPHFNLGIVLESAGRYAKAIPEYEAAMELLPDDVEIMEHLARCYIKTETKLDQAQKLIERTHALECRPEWTRWLEQQSRMLERKRSDMYAKGFEIDTNER